MNAEQMWTLVHEASDALADELGLESPPPAFTPGRALPAVDGWIADHDGPLDEDEATRLAAFLARVLLETHGGGLTTIAEKKHPLEGEWALTDFARGLDRDYHVPFFVSAARIGLDRDLTAVTWYRQLATEGAPPRRR